jgi:UDP-N-acetyl-D-mannosaminuronate dehydrogenase
VDDLRESPAIEVVKKLADAGAEVTVFEPFKPEFSLDRVKSSRELKDAVSDAYAIVLLVGHSEFKQIDPDSLKGITPARIVFDAVNRWDRDAWRSAGFSYYRLGDGKNSP